MTKKSYSKLVSIILTIAICLSSVLSCLVTANAAEDVLSYAVEGAQCQMGDESAVATVTFYSQYGIAAGSFKIENSNNWFKNVEATCDLEGFDYQYTHSSGVFLFDFKDSDFNAFSYNTVVIDLVFTFKDGGITESANINLNNVTYSAISDDIYENVVNNSESAVFSVGCQHKYAIADDATIISASTDLGYTVYDKAVCEICKEVKEGYQLVPDVDTSNTEGEILTLSGSASTATPVQLLDPNNPENSESNPYIIELPLQLMALARGVLKSTTSGDEYISDKGYYFKVKDGIKAFVMQSAVNEVMALSSSDEVYEYFTNGGKTVYWGMLDSKSYFKGHFDGNGVEIYGLFANYEVNSGHAAALFTVVGGASSFKNFSIKNSFIKKNTAIAGVVGSTLFNNSDSNDYSIGIEFENISIVNNYFWSTATDEYGASALGGKLNNRAYASVNNCLIYGNTFNNDTYEDSDGDGVKTKKSYSGLFSRNQGTGWASQSVTKEAKIKNVVAIGISPWTLNYNGTSYAYSGGYNLANISAGVFKNIYTDQPKTDLLAYNSSSNSDANFNTYNVCVLDNDDFKGDNAADIIDTLNQNDEIDDTIWFTGNGDEYPSLLKKNKLSVSDTTDYSWRLLGTNIEYDDNGSFSLNFHFLPSYESEAKLYVANTSNSLKSLIIDSYTTSSFANNGLPSNSKMFTIKNLLVNDLDTDWLASVVTTNKAGNQKIYGSSEQISVAEYCEKVVTGEAQNVTDMDINVAAALMNYSDASATALSTSAPSGSTSTATIIEKWDQTSDGKYIGWYDDNFDGNGDGSKDNPYIITSAEEFAQICRYGTEANTYYKVDPSIKAFDMNTVSDFEITMDDMDANYLKDNLANAYLGKVWFSDGIFKGNFDGSGVTIYGVAAGSFYYLQSGKPSTGKAGCASGSVFGKIDTSTASFKNFTIKNSYFTGKNCGAVFADTTLSGGSANIENVIVANCYIESTSNAGGAIAGYCQHSIDDTNKVYVLDRVVLNNCLVYNNVIDNNNGATPRLVGVIQPWNWNGTAKVIDPSYCSFNNIIAINCNIFETTSYWASQNNLFSNCYTTETNVYYNKEISEITKLSSADDAMGVSAITNMPLLDWEKVWLYGAEGKYPTILLSDKTNPVSIYSGTPDTTTTLSGDGSEANPYIIATADQFAAIALGKRVYAQGSYFKVADGINSFYLNGGATVATMTNVTDVETYFKANGGFGWVSSWDNSTANKSFSGHFDGNGVTIYGLYDVDSNSGLFEMAEDESSFKNFALKNSYIKAGSGAGVAAIVNKVSKQSDPDIMMFENIIIANNHIEQSNSDVGVGASAVLGYIYNNNDGVKINNCIIYDNNIINPNPNATKGLVSIGGNGSASLTQITNVISLGVKPFTAGTGYYLKVLDGNKCFVNVYTDQDCSAMANYSEANKTKYNFKDNLSVSDLQGTKAIEIADVLDWNTNENPDGIWYAGNFSDYPSFAPATSIPLDIQNAYDSYEINKYDDYGVSTETFGVDSTTLVLKTNPYISFIFALSDYRKYLGNGDGVVITFSDVHGNQIGETVTANDMINSESNGRYHKYYLKDVPIYALTTGITVTATTNEGTFDLGTYSAQGFALLAEKNNRMNPCDYYETRFEAVKSLVFYAKMLEERYGINQ